VRAAGFTAEAELADRPETSPPMATARARLTLDTGKLNRRSATATATSVASWPGSPAWPRSTARTSPASAPPPRAPRRHIDSIKSTTVASVRDVKVVTSSITYHGAPEKATRPHVVRPVRAKPLPFPVAGGRVVYAKVVHHPGAKVRNILRDGVRRAGRQLDRITR
jgi:hypothetical protein